MLENHTYRVLWEGDLSQLGTLANDKLLNCDDHVIASAT